MGEAARWAAARVVGWLVLVGVVAAGFLVLVASARAGDSPLMTDFVAVTDAGCGGCVVSTLGDEFEATIAGGADSIDSAYGVFDFSGGSGGWTGPVYVRDVIRVPAGQTLAGSLTFLQMMERQGTGTPTVLWELYLSSSGEIRFHSDALQQTAIDAGTGVSVPASGAKTRVEVFVDPVADSLAVRVDDVERVSMSVSADPMTAQAVVQAGIRRYDTSQAGARSVYHSRVGVTELGWLGNRTVAQDVPVIGSFVPVTDAGCGACTVAFGTGGGFWDVSASAGGAAESEDTAYAVAELGGGSGWSGRVWTRVVTELTAGVPAGSSVTIL